jgi:hypothetical protein
MAMIALYSLLIGAVLGTRLRVYVLFPAAMLGLVIVVTVAVFTGSAVSSAVAAAIACVISLQIGYLIGLFTRFCMAASRGAFYRPLPSTVAEN